MSRLLRMAVGWRLSLNVAQLLAILLTVSVCKVLLREAASGMISNTPLQWEPAPLHPCRLFVAALQPATSLVPTKGRRTHGYNVLAPLGMQRLLETPNLPRVSAAVFSYAVDV